MPILSSLHINLHQEEEVDFLLRNLPGLQVLNGLVVERDAIFSEDEEGNTDRKPLSLSSAGGNNSENTAPQIQTQSPPLDDAGKAETSMSSVNVVVPTGLTSPD